MSETEATTPVMVHEPAGWLAFSTGQRTAADSGRRGETGRNGGAVCIAVYLLPGKSAATWKGIGDGGELDRPTPAQAKQAIMGHVTTLLVAMAVAVAITRA